jgi:hypothetical protein
MNTLGDNDISLKEVLLQVSHKLDRFLEAHATLHSDMAARESKVDTILDHHEEWGTRIEKIEDWQTKVDAQLSLLKWLAGGGALGAGALILRLLGVPVP